MLGRKGWEKKTSESCQALEVEEGKDEGNNSVALSWTN